MTTKPVQQIERMSELLHRLGGVPAKRVMLRPAPGTATEADLVAHAERWKGLPCELIQGVLIEKAMGFLESMIASEIAYQLASFLRRHDLGIVVGAGAPMRMLPGLVRLPDVSVLRWEKLPGRLAPRAAIPDLYPDLAVEVLSKGNTADEMRRKLSDYFLAGVRLVWVVDPARLTVRVCTPDGETTLTEADSLDGGDVLPGLVIPVAPLFATVPDAPTPRKPRTQK